MFRTWRIHIVRWLIVLACLVTVPMGCMLFSSGDDPLETINTVTARKSVLAPLSASRDSIQLEVYFIERPADDPLLGPALWQKIDQISFAPPEERDLLKKNGFRIGHVSSVPPETLQRLLGMANEVVDRRTRDSAHLVGRRFYLRSGDETDVQTSEPHESCALTVRNGKGDEKRGEYDNARCVLRVTPTYLQEGWIRIDFTPQVHYDESGLRVTANDNGYLFRTGQKIETYYDQRFRLTLNVGELAVVTSNRNELQSLGTCFFRSEKDGLEMQRVLVVRVVELGKITPVSSR